MKLKDFVGVHKNKTNKQIKLEIKKRKLKEFDIDMKDLLNTDLNKKIKRFQKGK